MKALQLREGDSVFVGNCCGWVTIASVVDQGRMTSNARVFVTGADGQMHSFDRFDNVSVKVV